MESQRLMDEVVGALSDVIFRQNSPVEAFKALDMLVKIAENVLKDPDNVSKRSLKTTNPKVDAGVVKPRGALDLLLIMGFTPHHEELIATRDISLSGMKSVIRVVPARTSVWKGEHEKSEKERIDEILRKAREESSRARRRMGGDDFNPMNPDSGSSSSGSGRPNRRQQQRRGG